MKEALIKGETHSSEKDKPALMELDLSGFDAVFREGHDQNYFEKDLTSLYAFFAIGHLVYGATFGRTYISIDDFKEKAETQGVPVFDEIDAAVYETYEMVPKWKRIGFFLLSPFLAIIFLGIGTGILQGLADLFGLTLPPSLGILGSAAVVMFFGFLWALSFFFLIEDGLMYERDEIMAEEILRKSQENGFERVLVSCGGNHRKGIAEYLRDEGWKVEERSTDSPIGKILLWIDKVIEALLNPRRTLRWAANTMRSKVQGPY